MYMPRWLRSQTRLRVALNKMLSSMWKRYLFFRALSHNCLSKLRMQPGKLKRTTLTTSTSLWIRTLGWITEYLTLELQQTKPFSGRNEGFNIIILIISQVSKISQDWGWSLSTIPMGSDNSWFYRNTHPKNYLCSQWRRCQCFQGQLLQRQCFPSTKSTTLQANGYCCWLWPCVHCWWCL